MGPILIFDKSSLQGLNIDEAGLLDHFYLSNITPIFFIETLADLEKEVRAGRTPEDVVGNLAFKTPDFHSKPNIHHRTLLEGELAGEASIDMEFGRPHIGGGKSVELAGKMGVIFQQAPEEEALSRWHNHEFLQLERQRAKKWREGLSNINFEDQYEFFQSFFPMGKPKTLADVKRFVDFYIDGPDQERVLIFGLTLMGVSDKFLIEIGTRWRKSGKPSVKDFAPYFTHVFSIDLFFNLGIASDLISRGRPSHKIDLAYLYYLPFCMVFTSNDKLHADIVPFFLRDNQSFVLGKDLKEDLINLDKHYSALPEEVKNQGLIRFAPYPPQDDKFLITRLWDKHMSKKWRENAKEYRPPSGKVNDGLLEEMRRFEKEAKPIPPGTKINSDENAHMILSRKVLSKKGKWPRFPPEVLESIKKESD
ncbi:MAG TPA: hypothetical protein VJH06_03525 [Candidatus Paceibacterota bacterium]